MKKYNKKLTEAKKIDFDFEKFLKYLAKMTDDNAHGHARAYIAQMFKLKKFDDIFTAINGLHALEGSIPHNLGLYRDDVTKEMFKELERQYGKEIKDKVWAEL